jgi:hypothetical protein
MQLLAAGHARRVHLQLLRVLFGSWQQTSNQPVCNRRRVAWWTTHTGPLCEMMSTNIPGIFMPVGDEQ